MHNACWGKGTFDSVLKSLEYHFGKHGAAVGASNLGEYASAAAKFSENLQGARVIQQAGGAVKYIKDGSFIIIRDGKIVSFGAR